MVPLHEADGSFVSAARPAAAGCSAPTLRPQHASARLYLVTCNQCGVSLSVCAGRSVRTGATRGRALYQHLPASGGQRHWKSASSKSGGPCECSRTSMWRWRLCCWLWGWPGTPQCCKNMSSTGILKNTAPLVPTLTPEQEQGFQYRPFVCCKQSWKQPFFSTQPGELIGSTEDSSASRLSRHASHLWRSPEVRPQTGGHWAWDEGTPKCGTGVQLALYGLLCDWAWRFGAGRLGVAVLR